MGRHPKPFTLAPVPARSVYAKMRKTLPSGSAEVVPFKEGICVTPAPVE
jgi:hypothetical protein